MHNFIEIRIVNTISNTIAVFLPDRHIPIRIGVSQFFGIIQLFEKVFYNTFISRNLWGKDIGK